MSRYVVVDQDSFVPSLGDELNKDDIVDRDGYRDTKTMVEEMIFAGERLNDYRRGVYDYDEETPDFEINPVNEKGFDVIDAQKILDQQARKAKTSNAEVEKAKLEALKKVGEDKEKKIEEEKK